MIGRWLKSALLLAIVLTAVPGDAEARRVRFFGIPGFGGGGEELVKVIDLPRIPQLRREDGTYVDLGYN